MMMSVVVEFTTVTDNIYRQTSLRNARNYCVTLTLIIKLWGHVGGKANAVMKLYLNNMSAKFFIKKQGRQAIYVKLNFMERLLNLLPVEKQYISSIMSMSVFLPQLPGMQLAFCQRRIISSSVGYLDLPFYLHYFIKGVICEEMLRKI
jgi:hypothetical protein